MLASKLRLGVASHDADHLCAQRLRPLTQEETHSSRGRVHENVLAPLYAVSATEQVLSSQTFQHQRRSLLVGDALRDLHEALGGHVAELAVRTGLGMDIGDTIAYAESASLAAYCRDHAGGLAPQAAWQLTWIKTRTVVNVDVIEAYRRVTDLSLIGGGFTDFDVFEAQDLGAAVLMETHGFGHGPAIIPAFRSEPVGRERLGTQSTQPRARAPERAGGSRSSQLG